MLIIRVFNFYGILFLLATPIILVIKSRDAEGENVKKGCHAEVLEA